MGTLEKVLEHDVARKAAANARTDERARGVGEELDDDDEEEEADKAGILEPDDEKDLEPTPLGVADAAYDDDADDDVLDLGIKMGKMRLTERLGGFFRPKMNEEVRRKLDYFGFGQKDSRC